MRRFLVLLVLACLVVRWADAACGCAQHNGWGTLIAEFVAPFAHEHGANDAETEFTHGCHCEGPAIYASTAPIRIADTPAIELAIDAATSFDPMASARASHRDLSSGGHAASRAILQVYRI